ncbi:MAG: BMP family ABC transporter substrate-binding protein [Candidatus Bathyarchaeota archaeon]|jgi:basic membrane protein A
MASENTTLYAGVVIALIIGAAVGYFVYPSMNPQLSPEDYVEKTTYDALKSDYDDSQVELEAATTELGEVKSSLGGALAEAALSDIVLSEVDELTAGKKVGLVLATGGLGDKSFNDISYAGAEMAEEKLGIEFDYVEPSAIAEYEGFQRDFAMSGEYEIIICIGFDQADALAIIADEYPEQDFAIVDMVVDKPNVASLTFRANEGSFLTGVVAGMMSETDKVGFIGGLDIPLIRDFFVGYEAGAKWANPDIEVLEPVFVGGWADPTKGKELGTSLAELGADGIFVAAGKSGLGGLEAANEQGIYGYGVDACQCYLYPEIMASMTKRVDNAVFQMILASLLGTFEGGFYSGGLAESWTGMCRLPEEEALWESVFEFDHDALPEGVIEKVQEAKAKIISGDISVPSGYS